MMYEALTDERGPVPQLVSRGAPYVMRLACLYALLENSTIVMPRHLRSAFALWQYARSSAEAIFSGIGVEERILNALLVSPEGLTLSEIHGLFSRNANGAEIHGAVEQLAAKKRARRKSERTGGRPAERWFAIKLT